MSWVIKIENISKMYRLGTVGSSTIQDDLKRFWYRVRGLDDPFLKIGEMNKRDETGGDYVWALKDVNFEVNQGDIVGVIGKNGAGKSTLLKLLSKVTRPSTGKITCKGRIASLLEVGTGFHPELTGRENIFLNGAILGMKKNEITSKFDEIVDFSGCGRYIDTPVKRYSSGMHVRLAFAVAAHLDPEILIVDEVLAVGDAEFQKKAIGKMKDVSSNQGRTVLFVSHNIAAVQNLCTRAIVMENGGIKFNGGIQEGVDLYLRDPNKLDKTSSSVIIDKDILFTGKGLFSKLVEISIFNHQNELSTILHVYKKWAVNLKVNFIEDVRGVEIGFQISSVQGIPLGGFLNTLSEFKDNFTKGTHDIKVKIPQMYLTPGKYDITFWIKKQGDSIDIQYKNIISFTVIYTPENKHIHHVPEYISQLGNLVKSSWVEK